LPQPVEVDVGEGFSQAVSAQTLNVSKFHREQNASLILASLSKDAETIREELQSPSMFFKGYASKEAARFALSDDELKSAVLEGCDAVRKKLLKYCVRYRKVQLLEDLFQKLTSLPDGQKYNKKLLHGCSKKFVQSFFDQHKDLNNLPPVTWKKLAQFHPEVLLNIMKLKLAKDDWTRSNFWREMKGWTIQGKFKNDMLIVQFTTNCFSKPKSQKSFWRLFCNIRTILMPQRTLDLLDCPKLCSRDSNTFSTKNLSN
jgi:hypothetical protein